MKKAIVAIAGLAIGATACSGGGVANHPEPQSASLTVFAASSLTASFMQIGRDFQSANPGVTVTFNFGPSDALAGQIESEGTADVFASASPTWMDDVSKKVGVSDRADFARNELVIITPPGNPAHVASLEDLAKPGVQVVLAAAGVPVGDYARELLQTAGLSKQVLANVVSDEEDDASVVGKITTGEADAAIVYVSDVSQAVAPQVHAVTIPASANVIATYPIAVVNGSSKPTLARAFVAYVAGPKGQATLRTYGFLPPPTS